MRSLLLTILLWAVATIGLTVLGIVVAARALDYPRPREADPVLGMISMVEEEVIRAYDEGGREGLAAHLQRLNAKLPGERYLVDSQGRDLLDGTDRSAYLRPDHKEVAENRMVVVTQPRGDRPRLVWLIEPWFNTSWPGPLIAVVVATNGVMGLALAVYLTAPLRRLRRVMDRFGRGDLRARVGSRRRDEIGVVSREFDLLAERVETLVTAERRLLQDVSHEVRSPLTRLDFAVGMAMKKPDPGPFLDRIRRDVARLSDLVGELLQLTRLEGDPSVRVTGDIRPADLLAALVEDCSIEAEAKGCRLDYRADWPGTLKGDAELLRRAFENVMRNAIRHAPEGTAVEVSLELGRGGVGVVVRDHGLGVPAESLPLLFEPFYRVEGDRGRESGGVGLGLSIARRAIAVHGGHIEARNAEPGLSVAIVLPVS